MAIEPQKTATPKAADADVKAGTAGLMGRHEPAPAGVDELKGDKLLVAAKVKAPSLTAEFVSAYKLSDDELRMIARGEVPPPPTIGPVHTTDLYLTPAGWQQTPVGVKPEEVGASAIAR
jgi:hypothetical protein